MNEFDSIIKNISYSPRNIIWYNVAENIPDNIWGILWGGLWNTVGSEVFNFIFNEFLIELKKQGDINGYID